VLRVRGFLELCLEFRNAAVLKLRHTREIIRAMRRLEFEPGALKFLFNVRRALHGRFFGLPYLLEIGKLPLEFRELCLKIAETLLRRLVRFLVQRLALYLELNDAPFQAVHLLRLRIDLDSNA